MRSTTIWKLIAIYMAVGGGLCFAIGLSQLGFSGFVSSLWPALFTSALYIFIIVSGIVFLSDPNSTTKKSLLEICLCLQAVKFAGFGFLFENYFGIYLGLGIALEPSVKFFSEFSLLGFANTNGYSTGRDDMYIVINLIPIFVFSLATYLEKKELEKKKSEDAVDIF